jgi:hypothetical protein
MLLISQGRGGKQRSKGIGDKRQNGDGRKKAELFDGSAFDTR